MRSTNDLQEEKRRRRTEKMNRGGGVDLYYSFIDGITDGK
jgi:hypothetical protein